MKPAAGDYVGLAGVATACAGSVAIWGWAVTSVALGTFLVAVWLFIELRPRKGK